MLHKTRGIVLHTLPYNDKYAIAHLYTENFGRVTYMISHTRGKRTKTAQALFMPLSVLDLEVEHLNTRDLQRIREAKTSYPISDIYRHPEKNAEALFLSEVLYRVVREKEANPGLFQFLYDAIQWLDIAERGIANFHLVFLIRLVHYLGVYPNDESYRAGSFFDMQNGIFVASPPEHPYFLNVEESIVFARLLRMTFENMSIYTFTRDERNAIIQRILDYYRLHLPDFAEIKSLTVMQSLFD